MFSMRFSVTKQLNEETGWTGPLIYKIILNPPYTYVMVSGCPVAAVAQW